MKKALLILLVTSLLIGSNAIAENGDKSKPNNKKQVLQLLKKLNRTQNALAKKFNRLSEEAKQEVLNKTSDQKDSDEDSINDFIEGALDSNKCSADSDDDGVDDSDEVGSGKDPNDDDSDDDGHEDGVEFEVHGIIQSIDSSEVTVDGVSYVLNDNTEYLDDDNETVSNEFFEAGDCAEVEGHVSGGDNIVEKIKADDDC